MPDELEELRSDALDASKAFRRIATVFGLERKIPCTPAGWEELATAVEDRVAIMREPDFAKRAMMALELNDKVPPKERFADMVRRKVICPQGCVLLNGTFECDPERHK